MSKVVKTVADARRKAALFRSTAAWESKCGSVRTAAHLGLLAEYCDREAVRLSLRWYDLRRWLPDPRSIELYRVLDWSAIRDAVEQAGRRERQA